MSRSWFFFGLIAFTTAAGFAGCTITTDTDGGLGGAGGNGGDAFGGSAGEAGSGNGGTSNEGGTDQGGTSNEGGSSNQGGQSQGGTSGQGTTVTFDDAVAAVCAISAVSNCIGTNPPCVEFYSTANSDWPACEDLYTKYFECVAGVPVADIACTSGAPVVESCATEEEAWFTCAS